MNSKLMLSFMCERVIPSACCGLVATSTAAWAKPPASQASYQRPRLEPSQPTAPSIDIREFQAQINKPTRTRSFVTFDPAALARNLDQVVGSVRMTPVFGTHMHHNGRAYLRVIGITESEVWSAVNMDSVTSLNRIGKLIDLQDERLDDFDSALLDGHMVLAYSKQSKATPHLPEELEVIMKSRGAVFLIHKASANSFSIEKIGFIQK